MYPSFSSTYLVLVLVVIITTINPLSTIPSPGGYEIPVLIRVWILVLSCERVPRVSDRSAVCPARVSNASDSHTKRSASHSRAPRIHRIKHTLSLPGNRAPLDEIGGCAHARVIWDFLRRGGGIARTAELLDALSGPSCVTAWLAGWMDGCR